MSPSVKHLLQTFDSLPDTEKQEVAAEIIRRSIRFDLPSVSDEELVSVAEGLFLELDKRESQG